MERVYKLIKRLYKDQSGVSMVLVAILMVAILGFSAIVVDAGALYFKKGQLQKALDAAVLAGTQELRGKPFNETVKNSAIYTAKEIAQKNGISIVDDGTESNKIEVTQNSVAITQTVNENLYFARVLSPDFTDADVKAYAKAEYQSLLNSSEAIPMMLKYNAFKNVYFGQEFELKEEHSETGNFGFIAIDGSNGADDLRIAIENGVEVKIGDSHYPEPGRISSATSTLNARIVADNNDPSRSDKCNDPTKADSSCKRLVTIPIVDVTSFPNGRSQKVEIMGLAAFLLTEASGTGSNEKITGKFIEFTLDSSYTPNQGYPERLPKVKLIN